MLKRNGFTLVELLIVLTVLILIITISFSALTPILRFTERDSLKETFDLNIKQLFSSARAMSIKEDKKLVFDWKKADSGMATFSFVDSADKPVMNFVTDRIKNISLTSSTPRGYIMGIFTKIGTPCEVDKEFNIKVEFDLVEKLETDIKIKDGLATS